IGIEQPPLSLAMQKLERKMGGKLFDRSNRRIALTESGEALLPEVLKLLATTKHVVEKIRRINRGEAGVLNIGFTSSTIFCGVPELIQKHRQAYPHAEFSLRELSPAAQLAELKNGTLDVGFIREPTTTTGIACRPMQQEHFVAALSSKHPLAHKKQLRLKDLEKEFFVLFPQYIAPKLYDKLQAIFKAAQFVPRIVQEANEWQTIVNLVEANLGISICPSSFQKLQIGQIRYIRLTDVKITTGVSVCINADYKSKLVDSFLALIEAKVDQDGK
ncbi:MAG: LysR substrate-binding domain-containing protein, partial [Bacteroidota bacterium]|nr:LysR substrate-binding domain-containing protein [Bacteroidota bacterium]